MDLKRQFFSTAYVVSCCAVICSTAVITWFFGTVSLADDSQLPFETIECEGEYPIHLQGVCSDPQGAIYWSFTDQLVKTDSAGHLLQSIPVASHHGDLCCRDGKLFVAVNLGKFNRPAGEANSWVYEYDAGTLEELAQHSVAEVVHGAGGIDHHDGSFFVVGGLPSDFEENYLYEYDSDWKFRARHELSSGETHKGIQVATFHDGSWWLGCYGIPPVLLKANSDLQLEGRKSFDCALGLIGLNDQQFLVARDSVKKGEKLHRAKLVPAEVTPTGSLKLIDSQ